MPIEREVQDDSGHWYLTRILPYRSTDDRIEGVVTTFVDIDAPKRTEQSLRRSEERLRRMLNVDVVGVPDVRRIRDADRQQRCVAADVPPPGTRSARKLNRRILTPPISSDHRTADRRNSLRQAARRRMRSSIFGGTDIWLICTAAALDDRTVIEYCLDISDRKQAEQPAREARLYADTVIDALHEPLLVLGPDLTVDMANPAFCRHFEVEPENTVGRRFFDLGNGQWDIAELRMLLSGVARPGRF